MADEITLDVRLAVATAGVATVGAALVTVMLAEPFLPPAAAVTVAPPAVIPAEYAPLEAFMLPTPLFDQAKDGCGFIAAPNWSPSCPGHCRCRSSAT